MVVSDETRHRLYQKLEELLGPDEAATLMEHLPPVGWADVATKRDIEGLAVATKKDLDALAVATKKDLDALAVATRRDLGAMAFANQKEHEAMALAGKKDLEALANSNQLEHAHLAETMRLGLETLDHKLSGRFEREMRLQTWRLVTAVVAVGAMVTAGVRL
jgi:predicted TIM-barrel enzyme